MLTRNLFFIVLLALAAGGCNDDTLSVQRQFPFALTGESVGSTVKAGVALPFQLKINPERTTVTTLYRLKWRARSPLTPALPVDGVALRPNSLVKLKTLNPVLTFVGESPAPYKFEVLVVDEYEASQALVYDLIVAPN